MVNVEENVGTLKQQYHGKTKIAHWHCRVNVQDTGQKLM